MHMFLRIRFAPLSRCFETVHACATTGRAFSTGLIRSERQPFVRDERINLNVGVLGPFQHGKTTLVSAMTKALNESYGVPVKEIHDLDHSTEERKEKMSTNAKHVELWTDKFRFSLSDLPGHSSYIRNAYSHLSQMDVVFLIINPEDGIVQETIDLYYICQHYNIKVLPIIVKRKNTDEETVSLVKMELAETVQEEESLNWIEIESNESSDYYNSIRSFFNFIDSTFNNVKRLTESPLLFPMEQVGSIPSRGTFCAGRVQQGSISVGDQLEGFYCGRKCKIFVRDAEIFKRGTDKILAGDRGGVFVRLKPEIELKRGGVIFHPNAGKELIEAKSWRVNLKALPSCQNAVTKGDYSCHHYTHTDGKVRLEPHITLSDLQASESKIELTRPILAKPGDPILLRNNNQTILGNLLSPS